MVTQDFEYRYLHRTGLKQFLGLLMVKLLGLLFLSIFAGVYDVGRSMWLIAAIAVVIILGVLAYGSILFVIFANILFPPFLSIGPAGISFGTPRKSFSVPWREVRNVTIKWNPWYSRIFTKNPPPKWEVKFDLRKELSSYENVSAIKLPFFDFMFGSKQLAPFSWFEVPCTELKGVDPDELLSFTKLKIAEARQSTGA